MNKVQKTVGLWAQRIAGKARVKAPAQPARQLHELDARSLRQVSGGVADSPNKGW